MFQIDLKSRTPIYSQVIDGFKRLIIQGDLKEDEKIPSVREMAKTLAINPNTVQKAYKELETGGYFYTVLGQGSFIKKLERRDSHKIEELYNKLKEILEEMSFLGEKKEDIYNKLKEILEEMSFLGEKA
ncbi:MAG: GntR family transcriptional regulator [Defluviitaleaceae bacterium]|nr:GntR family transcriptional regulator [Defluviitaleaceae bacterium]